MKDNNDDAEGLLLVFGDSRQSPRSSSSSPRGGETQRTSQKRRAGRSVSVLHFDGCFFPRDTKDAGVVCFFSRCCRILLQEEEEKARAAAPFLKIVFFRRRLGM